MTEEEWLACAHPTPMREFLRGMVSDRKLRLFAVASCRPLLEKVPIPEFSLSDMVDTAERFADGLIPVSQLLDTFPEQDGLPALSYTPEFFTLNALGQKTCEAVCRLGWSPNEGPKWDQDFTSDEQYPQFIRGAWLPGEYAMERIELALQWSTQAWALLSSGCPYPGSPNTYGPWHEQAGVPESYFRCEKERFAWCAVQCREIFGNPFRPITINPNWLTATVTNLATIAYEERTLPSGELENARLAILADALEDAGCENQEILGHLRDSGPHVRGCWAVDLLLGRE